MKARNHSRVASALPHSESMEYKPPCGEMRCACECGVPERDVTSVA